MTEGIGYHKQCDGFRFWIPSGLPEASVEDQNCDVHVWMDEGRHSVATFYTPANLQYLMDKDAKFGDVDVIEGRCMYDVSWLVVLDFKPETLEAVLRHLLSQSEYVRERVFERAEDDEEA